jgi:hypothetical protein
VRDPLHVVAVGEERGACLVAEVGVQVEEVWR